MTDQPDLPPELLERVCMKMCRSAGSLCVGFCHSRRCRDAINQFSDLARAVAPMLIAHDRELAEAEVVAWMVKKSRETEDAQDAVFWRTVALLIERGEHRGKP